MTYIIVGASAGVGRAIANELAGFGKNLIIVSSTEEDLNATASDLILRFQVNINSIVQDIANGLDVESFYQKCFENSRDIEGILFPAGYWSEGDCGLSWFAMSSPVEK